MKLSKLSTVILIGLTLTLSAVGCKKKGVAVTPLPDAGRTGQAAEAAPAKPLIDDGSKLASEQVGTADSTQMTDPNLRKDWPRDREIFKSDTVHFDYDSSVIKTDDKSKVAAVADYLKGNRQDAVEIEGHCDARGTEEYNRSLGERRALALREELIRLGIEPSRVDTVSYGEDRPVDPGHDEGAYRKNRRGEFVLEKHQTLLGFNSPNNDPTK
jgi:peptidoglycan-associated lipoprotein